jgi:hypothetical protein
MNKRRFVISNSLAKTIQEFRRPALVAVGKLHELMKPLGNVGGNSVLYLAGNTLGFVGAYAEYPREKLHQIVMQMHQFTCHRPPFAGEIDRLAGEMLDIAEVGELFD